MFAVFAVVCIVAFLTNRGSDVGQLPGLVGNLGGGPLVGFEGFRDSVAGSIAACLIGLSWFGLGSFVASLIGTTREKNTQSSIFFVSNASVGAAVWSLVWFFLGIVGAYSGMFAICSIVIGLGLAALKIQNLKSGNIETIEPQKRAGVATALAILIAISLCLALVASLAPPIAKDALLYHLAVPKAFIAQHSNGFVDGNIASYLALGTEMHSVWAMLLGNIISPRAGEAAAEVSTFLFFPFLLLAIFGWAGDIGISSAWALIATLIVATVPTAYHIASSGYIDIALALYVTLAIYALTRWWKDQSWSWVILIGIFLGAALSIKLTSVFVISAFVLMILVRARGAENAGKIAISGFAALLLAGAIASPWYIRTWAATGSPVFPFYMSIWPGKANGWDVERSNLFQAMNSQYGGVDVNKSNYLTAPVRVSITAQPEQAANYDGVLGVAFLIGLPLLIWALWKFDLAVEIKIIAGIAAIMYLFWLFSSEQLRYLVPIAPLLAIAIAASAEKIGNGVSKVARCALVAASVCGFLVTFAWFCMKAPLRVVLGGETRDQYLTHNLDYYAYYQIINTEIPKDAKVWLINMRRDTYNIDRPIFSDYLFEDWTFRKMLWESRSAQELRTKTAAMGIKYVLGRHDLWFTDYKDSTLVDDRKPRAENEVKLKIAKEFILDPANTIKADNKFSLIKLF
jgi:hypothetical protein